MKGKAGAGTVLATHIHEPGGLSQTLEFLKRTRSELRQLRRAYAWQDRIHVCDVNRDVFEIVGLGYTDPDIIPVFAEINAAYDPQTIHHADRSRIQGVQPRPPPSLGRGPGDVKVGSPIARARSPDGWTVLPRRSC